MTEILIVIHAILQPESSFIWQWVLLWLTGVGGMLLGMAISAGVESADKAVMLMIIAVIPQILLQNITEGAAEVVAMVFVISYWSYQGLIDLIQGGDGNIGLAIPVMIVFAALYAGPRLLLHAKKGRGVRTLLTQTE